MKKTDDLTKTQRAALKAIWSITDSTGYPPTLRELSDKLHYRAVGSSQGLVSILRKKGYLINSPGSRARALLLTEKGKQLQQAEQSSLPVGDYLTIPCLGQVPAGHPIESIEHPVGTIYLSPSVLGQHSLDSRNLFGLQAQGESMIHAGILDGDWLIVERAEEGEVGDIVVARFHEDSTVKRLCKDRRGWYLKPENPEFDPIYAADQPFSVMGRVVALQRSFVH